METYIYIYKWNKTVDKGYKSLCEDVEEISRSKNCKRLSDYGISWHWVFTARSDTKIVNSWIFIQACKKLG